MLDFDITGIYKKDCRRICKIQYYDKKKHLQAESALISGEILPEEYNDHKLTDNLSGHRLLHVGGKKSDLVLMYRNVNGLIIFERIGTHREVLGIE